MRKFITFIICSIILLCVFLGMRQCVIYYVYPPDQHTAKRLYSDDKEDLLVVLHYFLESEDLHILIDKDSYQNNTMQVGGRNVDDKKVLNSLKRLFTLKGYNTVGRNGNTIYFERWSFGERSRGIAYTIDGESNLLIECIVKTEALTQDGWYYYEVDYGT